MALPGWGLLLAAFGPLFAAWPGVATPYTLPKLLVLALGVLTAALVAARAPGRGRAAGQAGAPPAGAAPPDLLRPLGVCLAVLTLSAAFSEDVPASLLGEYSQRGFGMPTLVLCAALAALAQGAGVVVGRAALGAGAVAGAALAAYGLLQLFGRDPVLNAVGSIPYGRIGSLVGSPVALGAALAMLLPLQLRLALDGADAPRRRAGWACLALGGLGLLFTWSRGGWLAAAAGAAAYLHWTGRVRGSRAGAAGLVAAALIGGALFVATGRVRPTARSDSGRAAVWESAWRMFAAHPVLGVGPDAFSQELGRFKTEGFVRAYGEAGVQAHAHNDFLQALSAAGLPGLAAYLWLLAAAWRRLRQALRDPAQRAGSAAAGAGLLAAFVVAKVNPLNVDGLALAALLLGLLDPRGALPRALAGAASAASAAALLVAGWLTAADRLCLLGMRAQHAGLGEEARAAYAAAARLNPAESAYGFWLVGLLREQARAETDPARRRTLGAEAVAAARAMERGRPRHVRSLHALGGSLAALTLDGGPDRMEEAAQALERGAAADWSYRSLLETRLSVARLRGDRRAYEDSAARLARLDALARRAGDPASR